MKTHEKRAENIKFLHTITVYSAKNPDPTHLFMTTIMLIYSICVESHERFERKLHISSYPSSCFAFNRLVSNMQRVRVRLQKRGVSNNILY